jgi:autotransporter-associated beta strand protein
MPMLSGRNKFSGSLRSTTGTLAVSADAISAQPGSLAVGGGRLQFLSSVTSNRAVTLTVATTRSTSTATTCAVGFNRWRRGLAKIGAGAFTLSGRSTYRPTAVNAGTLQATAMHVFGFTIAFGATLGVNSFNQIIGSLSRNATLGSASRTTGTSITFSGSDLSGTAASPIRSWSTASPSPAWR